MKFLILVVAFTALAMAAEDNKEKRGLLGLGYGGHSSYAEPLALGLGGHGIALGASLGHEVAPLSLGGYGHDLPLSYAAPAPIFKSYASAPIYKSYVAPAPLYKSYGAPILSAPSYHVPLSYSAPILGKASLW